MFLLHALSDRVPSQDERDFAEVEHMKGPLSEIRYMVAERQLMASACSRALANGVKDVEWAVVPGDPAQLIIERSKDFDIIVMGPRTWPPRSALAGQRLAEGQPARRRGLRNGQIRRPITLAASPRAALPNPTRTVAQRRG